MVYPLCVARARCKLALKHACRGRKIGTLRARSHQNIASPVNDYFATGVIAIVLLQRRWARGTAVFVLDVDAIVSIAPNAHRTHQCRTSRIKFCYNNIPIAKHAVLTNERSLYRIVSRIGSTRNDQIAGGIGFQTVGLLVAAAAANIGGIEAQVTLRAKFHDAHVETTTLAGAAAATKTGLERARGHRIIAAKHDAACVQVASAVVSGRVAPVVAGTAGKC